MYATYKTPHNTKQDRVKQCQLSGSHPLHVDVIVHRNLVHPKKFAITYGVTYLNTPILISCVIVKIKSYNLITWVSMCHNCQNFHIIYDSDPTVAAQHLLHKFSSTAFCACHVLC
jgi:hypothetical protein